jgi:hypothetical protein
MPGEVFLLVPGFNIFWSPVAQKRSGDGEAKYFYGRRTSNGGIKFVEIPTVESQCLRFGRRKYLFNRSVLAMFCSLFGSPEEAAELLLAALALRFRRWAVGRSRGRGPDRGARGVYFSGRRRSVLA